MEKTLIRDGLVLTMATDEPKPVISDILIEGNCITQIGDDLSPEGVSKTINAAGKVVMPGGISHNPVSNQKLGCGIAPVIDFIKEGITVALGTDGPASALTLDMFEEIKSAAWLQKNNHFEPTAITHNDICALLAYSANGGDVDTPIVNGTVVMENRRLKSLNEEEVLNKAQECARRIIA